MPRRLASIGYQLTEKSQLRVSKSDKFAKIRKDLEESTKSKGIIHLAEIRKKAGEEKKSGKKDAAKKKARNHEVDPDELPVLQESENILMDMIDAERAKGVKQAKS
jgi:hypothetical protein